MQAAVHQLMLWDAVEEDSQDPGPALSISERCQGHIIIRWTRWADGDTSPEQLDRLALLMLGGLESATRCDGIDCFFRIISTAVIDSKVVMACEYISTVKEFYGGKEDGTTIKDNDVD